MDRDSMNEDEARGSLADERRAVIGPRETHAPRTAKGLPAARAPGRAVASRPAGRRQRSGRISACLVLGFALACSESGDMQPADAPDSPPRPAQGQAAAAAPAKGGAGAAGPARARSREELIAAGRSVYNANCIACHAIDPRVDGALGPAVAGSSLELLRARVVHGSYPEGYQPKRTSRVMVPLPHLEPKLPELAAYLQSLEG